MKKKILLLLLSLSSCKTYLDRSFIEDKISNDKILLECFGDYNILTNNDKIGVSGDNIVFYPQHFKIMIPKKIKSLKIIDKVFCIEYSSKQIIFIDAGYKKENNNTGNWELIEGNNDLVDFYCSNYLSVDNIATKKRVNKLYTDGKTKILLVNIKVDNFDNYLKLIKSFKYE